jgi:hypothetical protein
MHAPQAACRAKKAQVMSLNSDKRLSERVWRTIGPMGLSDTKRSLVDLLHAWKGACMPVWLREGDSTLRLRSRVLFLP